MTSPPEMSVVERYALGLLVEEMGEAIQIIGKWLRFGEDAGPDQHPYWGRNARQMLPAELGDVLAAIDFATSAGLVDRDEVGKAARRKLGKLLSSESRDAQGKRLAPDLDSILNEEDR